MDNSNEKKVHSPRIGTNGRNLSVGDPVVYKPFENCREEDISNVGKVMDDLGNGDYKVTFGYTSIHGTRTGIFNHSNLWNV